jgi:hypothetical protein
MDILQGIVLILMCLVILLDVQLPHSVRKIGMIPLMILGFMILLYLFQNSPVLGIIGIVVMYVLFQTPKTLPDPPQDTCEEDQPAVFTNTLEEEVIRSMTEAAPAQSFNPSFTNSPSQVKNAMVL